MTTDEQFRIVEALVNGQGTSRAKVTDNVLALIRQLIATLAGQGWYDNRAVAAVKVEIRDTVRQGQEVIGDTTGAFLDQVLDELDAKPARGGVVLPERLRAVDPMDEWERPAKEYRRLRLVGLEEFEAQERALRRAEQQAKMDLDLAMREAARQRITNAAGVLGYRRIIHPELSRTGSCGLCVVAADRFYRVINTMALHNGCNCDVLPVTRANDPGKQLNEADIKRIYGAAGGSTDRQDLQRVRVQVNEHGELGAVLTAQGEEFRDETDASHDLGRQMTPEEVAAAQAA